MAEAARIAVGCGADIVDINFGCPVKKVAVGQQAGSALMRDEVAAARILEATVQGGVRPRHAQDADGLGPRQPERAPRLSAIAEQSGIRMVTGARPHPAAILHRHRRLRDFIAQVKAATALRSSPMATSSRWTTRPPPSRAHGADGVMVGRGCYGRPWFPAQVAHFLRTGERLPDPDLATQHAILLEHYPRDPGAFRHGARAAPGPQACRVVFARGCTARPSSAPR